MPVKNKDNIVDSNGEIILYKSRDGKIQLDVKLQEETVWLSLNQISELFERDKSNISRHIRNIYHSRELPKNSTVAKNATVQIEGGRKIKRNIYFYNLDIILSIGYRVNSKRGTEFRIWSNKILKDYLIKGYALNEKRLKEQSGRIKELEKTLEIFSNVINNYVIEQDEFAGILKVVADYTYALGILDKYDNQTLSVENTAKGEKFQITYDSSIKVIQKMKERFPGSAFFGKEKDQSFQSTVNVIYQTFNKKELYPSIDEKAAHLLYLTIKNHSFIDGNKRIAAALFLWFLEMNNYLYKPNGEKRIADNALVALCLLVAESKSKEKDMIIKVIINLINKSN